MHFRLAAAWLEPKSDGKQLDRYWTYFRVTAVLAFGARRTGSRAGRRLAFLFAGRVITSVGGVDRCFAAGGQSAVRGESASLSNCPLQLLRREIVSLW